MESSKAHPFAHVFDSLSAAGAQTQHRINDFWQHDGIWTRYHLQPRKKLFGPGDEVGEFAKSLHPERVAMFDKSVKFKGLPILNMHFSDEDSTIIEDDMTVDQKVQTVDFWTGRTIFKYGEGTVPATLTSLPYLPRTDRVLIVTKGKPRMRKRHKGLRASKV